jgi:hypothetical protein
MEKTLSVAIIQGLPTAPQLSPQQLEVAWQRARKQAAEAYARWCEASTPERRDAYAAFLAAADREAAGEAAFLRHNLTR